MARIESSRQDFVTVPPVSAASMAYLRGIEAPLRECFPRLAGLELVSPDHYQFSLEPISLPGKDLRLSWTTHVTLDGQGFAARFRTVEGSGRAGLDGVLVYEDAGKLLLDAVFWIELNIAALFVPMARPVVAKHHSDLALAFLGNLKKRLGE